MGIEVNSKKNKPKSKLPITFLKLSFIFTFTAIPFMTISGVSLSDKVLIIVFCYLTLLFNFKIFLNLPITYIYGLMIFIIFALIGVIVKESSIVAYAYVANYFVQIILFICFIIVFYKYRAQRLEVFQFIYVVGVINAIVALIEKKYYFELQNYLVWLRQKNYLYGRSSGFFDNPNHLGIFLAVVFIIGVYFFLVNQKKAYIIGNALIFMGLISAGSRSAFLGFLIGNLLLLYYLNKYNLKKMNYKTLFFFIFFTVVGIAIGSMSGFNRISIMLQALFEGDFELATGYRATIWINALQLFKENMMLGVGNGNFQENIAIILGETRGIHSLYLSLLVENGLVGFSIFISFLIITWKNSIFITDKEELILFKTLMPTLLITQITEMQLYNVFQFVFIFWLVLSIPYSYKLALRKD